MKKLILVCCILVASCLTDTTRPTSDKDAGIDTTLLDVRTDIQDGTQDIGIDDKGDTAPIILSTNPEDLANSVARTGPITATFSESILIGTIDALSFSLQDADGNKIPGKVTFANDTFVATFQPDQKLDILSVYSASLSTSITDLRGNPLATSKTWSFTTTDGVWTGPMLVEADNRGDAGRAQIVFGKNGNAFATWTLAGEVFAKSFQDGVWKLPEAIGFGQFQPDIAIDKNGNAIVVWSKSDGTRFNIWANRFDGTDWGSAELIETEDGDANSPQIDFDQNGNAIAVWSQTDGTRFDIWGNRFDGTTWGVATRIESEDEGDALNVQIAVDDTGIAHAIWGQRRSSSANLWSVRFNSNNWSAAEMIGSHSGSILKPKLALDQEGKGFAVWTEYSANGSHAWRNRLDGTWNAAERIETISALGEGPGVAVAPTGDAFVTWAELDDDTVVDIWIQRFRSDLNQWETKERLDTTASSPEIRFDAKGNGIAVWIKSDGTFSNIWARRFDGTSWAPPQLLETEDVGHARSPQVAIDDKGNAIVVWEQSDGNRYNIWSNRFE